MDTEKNLELLSEKKKKAKEDISREAGEQKKKAKSFLQAARDSIMRFYKAFVKKILKTLVGIMNFIRMNMTITSMFITVFLAGWYSNGTRGTNFDLSMLITFYGLLAGVKVTGHTVNSMFNSPRNVPPTKG